jgi:hypothetical protein
MKRILMLFSVAAMIVVMSMSASMASAQDWSSWNWDPDSSPWWWHHDDDRFDDEGFGDFGPDFADQELESGDIDSETSLSIEGNNNNQCVGALQFGNTGNFANQQGTSQYDISDEFEQEFAGPEVEFAPENETACEQEVQQAAAASSFGS